MGSRSSLILHSIDVFSNSTKSSKRKSSCIRETSKVAVTTLIEKTIAIIKWLRILITQLPSLDDIVICCCSLVDLLYALTGEQMKSLFSNLSIIFVE